MYAGMPCAVEGAKIAKKIFEEEFSGDLNHKE